MSVLRLGNPPNIRNTLLEKSVKDINIFEKSLKTDFFLKIYSNISDEIYC